MLEYFLYGNDISTPPSSYAGETQGPSTPYVPKGHKEEEEQEEEDMNFQEDATLSSEPVYS